MKWNEYQADVLHILQTNTQYIYIMYTILY